MKNKWDTYRIDRILLSDLLLVVGFYLQKGIGPSIYNEWIGDKNKH